MLNSDLLKASVSLLVASSPASAAERLDAPKLESRRARNRFRTYTQYMYTRTIAFRPGRE
jgi:hypothetical protein